MITEFDRPDSGVPVTEETHHSYRECTQGGLLNKIIKKGVH